MSRAPGTRLSRKALDALDADVLDATNVPTTADSRPAQLDKVMAVKAEDLATVQEVFAGTRVVEDDALIRVVLDTTRTVASAWERAGRSFLEIGRALVALEATLHGRDERARLKSGCERLFPFSDPIASQFRRVALMVEEGRVPEDALPGSYSAAYQIALLEPEQLQEAQRRGLVSPRTSRAAVIAFRREITEKAASKVDLRALDVERKQLLEKRRRMLAELVLLRARVLEIGRLLDS